jgi:eukaryotic-like serine/threonine-protein kinase
VYKPGTVLDGKYRVEGMLGRGGMGVVVAAEHVELRTRVALKFLADKYVEDPSVTERFMREARACAQLRSEHICRVSDVGRLDNGVPYIVMELLTGRDLAKELRDRVTLDVATAADYVVQACDAIIEAHAAQIVHRDLKPSNLFLTERRDGSPLIKVLDFGVAKAQSDNDNSLTSTDSVVGSPNYMSPEQLRSSKAVDARSDIWSLGVILHELVAGRPPFTGETVVDLAVRISHEPPELPTGVPPELAAIIARCLQKDPSSRYQKVTDLVTALAPFAASKGPRLSVQVTTVRPIAETSIVAPASTTLRSASGAIAGSPAPKRRRRIVISAAAAIVIGVVAGLTLGPRYLFSSSAAPQAAPAPVTVNAPASIDGGVVPDAATIAEPTPTASDAGVPATVAPKPVGKHSGKHRTKEQIGASRI